MSDYTVRIKAVLDAQDAEKKLQELQKKKTVELVVKLTGDDTDCAKKFNKMMSSVTESAAKAGQQIRKLLSANTNLSNPKGDDSYNIAYQA